MAYFSYFQTRVRKFCNQTMSSSSIHTHIHIRKHDVLAHEMSKKIISLIVLLWLVTCGQKRSV